MTVKSFGCSFIFGSDLADDGRGQNRATPSQLTWCAHLARDLKQPYECHARPGSGNLQILERILNQVEFSNNKDLFVIGWTWIDRFDYYDPHYNPATKLTPWSTIMPIDTDETAKIYYRDLHSEYRDKFTSLSYVKLAVDTLKNKDIPFVMTYMDELMFDQRWHTSPSVLSMQQYLRPHMTRFEDQTFLDWAKQKGFPISETLHPLEPAHQAAFELIKSYNLV